MPSLAHGRMPYKPHLLRGLIHRPFPRLGWTVQEVRDGGRGRLGNAVVVAVASSGLDPGDRKTSTLLLKPPPNLVRMARLNRSRARELQSCLDCTDGTSRYRTPSSSSSPGLEGATLPGTQGTTTPTSQGPSWLREARYGMSAFLPLPSRLQLLYLGRTPVRSSQVDQLAGRSPCNTCFTLENNCP